jgi:hypothetical protein
MSASGAVAIGLRLSATAVALSLHLAGCTTGAPPELRRSMEDATWKPTGAFARLRLPGEEHTGELIAVEPEAFILETNGHPVLVPPQCVEKVHLAMFEANKGPVAAWGSLGALSTLSHGGFLVLTGPIWLISMGIATAAQSQAGTLQEQLSKATPEAIERLRAWARFPQGLPSGYLPSTVVGSRTGTACGQPYALPSRWFAPR